MTIINSQLTNFIEYCTTRTGRHFDYDEFTQFCRSDFRAFWQLFLDWVKISAIGDPTEVCRGDSCETAQFFPDLRFNYADALLQSSNQPAIAACHKGRPTDYLTHHDVRTTVTQVAGQLRQLGVQPGDRVAAIARNNAEVVIAALASAAIGAVFSSCAIDMGVRSIVARLGQLEPVVLFANLRPEPWDVGDPLAHRVNMVMTTILSIRTLIALDDGSAEGPVQQFAVTDVTINEWQQFPFNHPLFILFSSGTTGMPKCIIHGAGGTLLEHLKEHRLHGDLTTTDKMFFQTNCGWMMWNWQLSALACGTELVLYDGPLEGPATLWRLIADERVTVFGTNPAYLQFCETAGFSPQQYDLRHLRSILSTGSILYPHQFDWIMHHVGLISVQSISGGTDIIGCFVLGNPNLPVYRGEAQCCSLGLDVQARDTANHVGELICAQPFPSRPLGFFNDPDGSRFHAAYFSQNAGVWTHGDLIELTPHGGAILHGRSDSVLNIRGVRIGPAEIYRLLQDIPPIIEAMAVEQYDEREPGGTRLILLVITRKSLDAALTAQIRSHLMTHGTSVMVPARIIEVAEFPTTHSGKRSEAAARDAVNGYTVRNREALRNPECLDQIITKLPTTQTWQVPYKSTEVLENWLQRVCEAELGVAPIGWSDNLLQYGDSLTFLNLYLELGKAIGYPLPWLTTSPSIVQLAAIIRDEKITDTGDQIIIRPATKSDADPVCQLLRRGFRCIPPSAWQRLFDYPWTVSPPNYGFVLIADQTIVGYMGALYADRSINDKHDLVCNLTSWYIEPAYRGWGAAMLNAVLAINPTITYTVLTPATLPKQMFSALQFNGFTHQSLALLPLLHCRSLFGRATISFDADVRAHLTEIERKIFDDHRSTDCLHVLVRDGAQYAYMVVKRRRYRLHRWCPWLTGSKVLYCGNPELVRVHIERVKLAILWQQRTLALIISAQWLTVPWGISIDSHLLARSTTFESNELDALYSEVCLLPV